MLWWRASLSVITIPNKLRVYVCVMPKQLQQPGNLTNTQHVRIKCQRDIYVRMYVHAATTHTHTLV